MRRLCLYDRPELVERGKGGDPQNMVRDLLSAQVDAWHLVTENIFFPCLPGKRDPQEIVVVNLGKGA